MQKFVTNLWFNDNAEEAATFYASLFDNSRVNTVLHYSEEGAEVSGMKKGAVLMVDFELDGQNFILINGGPAFKLTEAVSISVNCKDQAEIDKLWGALTADGGEESVCGWLKDKFGLSWQIVPEVLNDWQSQGDSEKLNRMMAALYKMTKIDLATLEKAYNEG